MHPRLSAAMQASGLQCISPDYPDDIQVRTTTCESQSLHQSCMHSYKQPLIHLHTHALAHTVGQLDGAFVRTSRARRPLSPSAASRENTHIPWLRFISKIPNFVFELIVNLIRQDYNEFELGQQALVSFHKLRKKRVRDEMFQVDLGLNIQRYNDLMIAKDDTEFAAAHHKEL